MTSTLGAGLAWAVPVRPDVLGAHLEGYEKALPTLRILRLCHRFGRGQEVYLTKLPVEMEQAVEEYVILGCTDKGNVCEYDWHKAFACFESRCDPAAHVDVDPTPPMHLADVEDQMCQGCSSAVEDRSDREETWSLKCVNLCKESGVKKCDVCLAGFHDMEGWCEDSCVQKRRAAMNEFAFEDQDIWLGFKETHARGQGEWLKRIEQGDSGGFAKYAKVLRDCFGLEVFFSNTQKHVGDAGEWPIHRNHKWHEDDELKTTLCYLMLRSAKMPYRRYEASENQVTGGFIGIEATRAMRVELPSIDQAACHTRFQWAMNTLGLTVYVHPSQQQSAPSEQEASATAKDIPEGTKTVASAEKDGRLDTVWPQLTMLVHGSFSEE